MICGGEKEQQNGIMLIKQYLSLLIIISHENQENLDIMIFD